MNSDFKWYVQSYEIACPNATLTFMLNFMISHKLGWNIWNHSFLKIWDIKSCYQIAYLKSWNMNWDYDMRGVSKSIAVLGSN